MNINIGCGENKLKGYINIDSDIITKPDLVCNLKQGPLPFKDESIEKIVMFHSLEHIEIKYWPFIFKDFRRLLKLDGNLYLAYPEFERCALNYINNERGAREFWRATLYGRQNYTGDYHVVPMRTSEVIQLLQSQGFKEIKSCPEDREDWNTFLSCKKGAAFPTKQDILRKEIFTK